MANEEVLGPRKTMFVLVIVVGCFAVLWPRILSPLILGNTREQLKPNQFDREAGCCEVIFETEVAVLELLNEVCSSVVHVDGKLSPYAAAECRKAVNETCGVDIAAFLKRDENVGRTTKKLVDMMKSSNSSCLKEHFGVPQWSISTHLALNSWTQPDTLKQERPPMRTGPHPALRERGRAIPPGTPAPPPRPTATMPPHARVRSSPLSVYYELEVKPPPIPGMRPPLGSPGGPVASPKSSMGFVMPIYTICIIVFFVYTLSKILFKRTGSVPYEEISPDPQFRRRVFRDDSRTSPDKLVVTAISGLVAEVQQQMEASYTQNQQRQELQDNHTRPYTNGTVLHNTGPVHIVASEYKDKSPEPAQEQTPEPKEPSPTPEEPALDTESKPTPESKEPTPEHKESTPEPTPDVEEQIEETTDETETKELSNETEEETKEHKSTANGDLVKLSEHLEDVKDNAVIKASEEFLKDAKDEAFKVVSTSDLEKEEDKRATPDLLEEALKEDKEDSSAEEEVEGEQEKSSVKVVGMEVTAHTVDGGSYRAPRAQRSAAPPTRAHEADEVKSIFLETEIPQQSRVLVAEFEDRAKPAPTHHSPMVVSGKMTLSLIQDAPRDTPDRDLESTVDDFTTASAVTQPAAEKDDLSDEEVEEEIEVEEIEEEVEEVEEIEEEEEEEEAPAKVVAPSK